MKIYTLCITLVAVALGILGIRENRRYAHAQAEADTVTMLFLAKLLPSQIEIINAIDHGGADRIQAIRISTLNLLKAYDESLNTFKAKHPKRDVGYFEELSKRWKSELKK